MLKGILTLNLVPCLDDGRINEGELRRIINWLIEKGVRGLYPNGSTGAFIRLCFEERKRVIQIVAEATRGRVPVLARAGRQIWETWLRPTLSPARPRSCLPGCRINRLSKDMLG
jgi:dihydrodipicolinate synthase/N-acetylneuraminate lyase